MIAEIVSHTDTVTVTVSDCVSVTRQSVPVAVFCHTLTLGLIFIKNFCNT